MIDVLSTSDSLCKAYMRELLDDRNAETVMEILLEGEDSVARKQVARIMKYLHCKLKMIEKAEIESGEIEIFT